MPSHCPPDGKCQLEMAFVTDSCRPQPLCQPLPTACLTAPGAASEVPSLVDPWWRGRLAPQTAGKHQFYESGGATVGQCGRRGVGVGAYVLIGHPIRVGPDTNAPVLAFELIGPSALARVVGEVSCGHKHAAVHSGGAQRRAPRDGTWDPLGSGRPPLRAHAARAQGSACLSRLWAPGIVLFRLKDFPTKIQQKKVVVYNGTRSAPAEHPPGGRPERTQKEKSLVSCLVKCGTPPAGGGQPTKVT